MDCCQRELESNKRQNAFERELKKHDIVHEKERRRRNLVTFSDHFSGCRCTFDPNSDGVEYPALTRLRTERNNISIQSNKHETNEDHINDEKDELACQNDDSDDEYDYLLDDIDVSEEDNELKLIQENRRIELEFDILKLQVAQQHGYGVLRHMHPSRILRAAGLAPGTRDPPFAVVVHLFDPESVSSPSLDLHLESIAPKLGRGTKFMSSCGRSVLTMDRSLASRVLPKFQVEKDIPALLVVREGVVVNICHQLLGLSDDRRLKDVEIIPDIVTDWLRHCNCLVEEAPDIVNMCLISPVEDALISNMMSEQALSRLQDRYDCGVADCNKNFFHEHVGISNTEQTGLVLSEATILAQNDEVTA